MLIFSQYKSIISSWANTRFLWILEQKILQIGQFMSQHLSRRDLLGAGPAALGIAAFLGTAELSSYQAIADTNTNSRTSVAGIPDEFPRQESDVVREIVGASHFNLNRVKELVTARPALAKASWDWGFGDWETAIGAASHVGRRDIAEILLQHGARPTLFTLAMLGYVDAVRATIEAQPGIQQTPGPHSITLLAHAKAGGTAALAVVEYLQKLGGADNAQEGLSVPDQENQAIQGMYAYGPGKHHQLKVYTKQGALALKPGEQTPRNIIRIGPWEYQPMGAPAVRIRFDSSSEQPKELTIVDAALSITAKRLPN